MGSEIEPDQGIGCYIVLKKYKYTKKANQVGSFEIIYNYRYKSQPIGKNYIIII
jgi:hypothetical protein